MNRKQLMIKKTAKRAKAKLNKIVPDNPVNKPKTGYISKAVRAKMALEEEQNQISVETESIEEQAK